MLLDGKKIAAEISEKLHKKLEKCQKKRPGLTFFLVGENIASLTYVQAKKKACAKIGIHSDVIHLPDTTSEETLLQEIEKKNKDSKTHGILVQLPLPSTIRVKKVVEAIDPKKDVDGFHPLNVGKLLLGFDPLFVPCTPKGIQLLLQKYNISLDGKKVAILGRSNIVGKPLAALLMQKNNQTNATVTVLHSHSPSIEEITRSSDVLIAAMGQPRFVKKEMVKPGAVVVDVGIHRSDKGKLIGDVDFEEVSKIASFISPVPGGVGPMTIAMLMQNTVQSFERSS